MKNLPNSLKEKAEKYLTLDKAERIKFVDELHNVYDYSVKQIAELCNTYPNRIRRDVKGELELRSRSEAQKNALKTGRHPHPTKGTNLSAETKMKISEKLVNCWDNLTDEEREYRSQIGRERWDSMTPEEQADMRSEAAKAIRETANSGSKLENFLKKRLTEDGWFVEFHKEKTVVNQRLQMDMFLPTLKVVIEVDGPSHFSPIWGQEALDKNKRADNQKNALVLGLNWCMIRVRQRKYLSLKYKEELWNSLKRTLENIKDKFPPREDRLIYIGEENG